MVTHTKDFLRLPEAFNKNGYNYKLIYREDDVAIYSQNINDNQIAFEVFEVRKNKQFEIDGRIIPARESVPSSEQWGNNAFTVHSLLEAAKYMERIKERIRIRNITTL